MVLEVQAETGEKHGAVARIAETLVAEQEPRAPAIPSGAGLGRPRSSGCALGRGVTPMRNGISRMMVLIWSVILCWRHRG
jgi:hypothetical protein